VVKNASPPLGSRADARIRVPSGIKSTARDVPVANIIPCKGPKRIKIAVTDDDSLTNTPVKSIISSQGNER
jgi:hypothetical protein